MSGNLPPPPPPPPGQGASVVPRLDAIAKSILKKKGINSDPLPNIDQMVILFLRDHDVDVRPPSGTRAGDAVSGAFFGAFGPAASFAGSHLRQQEKIAAMQEWTSWKQWALGHADWPAFKEKIKSEFEENLKTVNETVNSSWFQSEYQEQARQKREMESQNIRLLVIFGLILASVYASFFLIAWLRSQFEPKPFYPSSDYDYRY